MQCTVAVLILVVTCFLEKSQADSIKKRVIHGEEFKIWKYPWAAAIRSESGSNCGASFLNERWLITAGHCVADKVYGDPQDMDVTGWYVQAGSRKIIGQPWRYDKVKGGNPVVFRVEKIVVHPKYNGKEYENDLTLIKLKEAVDFSKYDDVIQPIALPDSNMGSSWPPTGIKCYFVGWGCYHNYGSVVEIGELAHLPILDPNDCISYYATQETDPGLTEKIEFCAGYEGDRNKEASCQGDSGSGMVCEKDGKKMISGVISAGPGDADMFPVILTRVSVFTDWIKQVMETE